MRIFDPKDQLGNSLLSSADTALSSKRLEKQMAVGEGAITLSSADISDIENWELCNASVVENGKTVSFLPETSKDEYGNITVVFGETFQNVVLVLKRVEFDGMHEQEEITIEVEIRRLMGITMATAGKAGYDADVNIAKWQELGGRAKATGEDKYKYADVEQFPDDISLGEVVTESFLSLSSLQSQGVWETVKEWRSDLPSLQDANCLFISGPLEVFEAKMPNLKTANEMFANNENLRSFKSEMPSLQSAFYMFSGCTGLTSWTVELPNTFTDARSMFQNCTGLTSFTQPSSALPNSLTDASHMFNGCSGLKSWTVELPNSLTSAERMFDGCSGLTSFSTPSDTLPNSLTNAHSMFSDCTGLKEFTPSLAGLTNCEDFIYMFSDCILNEKSIRNILGTLPDRTGKTKLIIDIGGDKTMEESVRQQLSSLAQSVSTAKNWTIVLDWNPTD